MNQSLDDLEEPSIPLRNDRKEIDLELLGEDPLETYIKYTGMASGDRVDTTWWGINDEGRAFDDGGSFIVADTDLTNGLMVQIGNAAVKAADGGVAFYSYRVNGGQESLRAFSYIGLRAAEGAEGLPVVLAVESHGLIIKPRDLAAAGVAFIVAPYQALKIGDTITFTFKGFDGSGVPEKPIYQKLTVTKEHLASKPLKFMVGRGGFNIIDPGYAEVAYEVDFGDGKKVESPVQTLTIDSNAALPGYLPEPVIVGHVPGEKLNPGNFRSGLTVTVEGYPGMAISDRVTLLWRSSVRDFLQTVRVDASTQIVGDVEFHIPFDYLLENQGLNVKLSCLFGRKGAGQRSKELNISVDALRKLSAPMVKDTTADGQSSGTLSAEDATGGAWVELPDVLLPGERAEVEWRGWPGYGRYMAEKPEGSNPQRFYIPAQYVPANMGRGAVDESRRFEVVYWIFGEGEPVESEPYHLRIKPIPLGLYSQIDCDQVEKGELSLRAVPADGADLVLPKWPYAREGNLIDLSITGVTSTGPLKEVIRDASEPVTEVEARDGVQAKLDRKILERLQLAEKFTLHAYLSFDGGEHYIYISSLDPALMP
ncbi:hypothetical protein ABE484_17435 [Pseudomonas pudica]|uniref:hypothetical protein n=1 Tax=Pseudomonas TaxID=286 RepID=UPI000A1D8A3B|nr:hypothetical protein [Pseudomonas sp. B10(2017)]